LAVKPTSSEKITVLSIFLESSLNFLSNNLKNSKKFSTVREKSGIKIELTEIHFERTVNHKIGCKTHLQ